MTTQPSRNIRCFMVCAMRHTTLCINILTLGVKINFRLFSKFSGNDESNKTIGKEYIKRMKELGLSGTKGELEKKVEEVNEVERMWSVGTGNQHYALHQGQLFEMLSSYALPFLFYKQKSMFNIT